MVVLGGVAGAPDPAIRMFEAGASRPDVPTRGPSWGHSRVVLGTIGSILSPQIDRVS
jgi:hypothetical protein